MKKFWIHNLFITLSLLVVFLVTLYSIGIYNNFRIAIHSQFDHRPLQYQAPNCQYGFTGNYIRVIFLSNNYLHVQLFIYIMLKTAYTRINGL